MLKYAIATESTKQTRPTVEIDVLHCSSRSYSLAVVVTKIFYSKRANCGCRNTDDNVNGTSEWHQMAPDGTSEQK